MDDDGREEVLGDLDDFRHELELVPTDRVYTRRAVAAGFGAVLVMLAAVLAGIVGITLDTRRAVEGQVAPLQARTADLEETAADAESVIAQCVAGVQMQNEMLRDAGVEPPEIVLLP